MESGERLGEDLGLPEGGEECGGDIGEEGFWGRGEGGVCNWTELGVVTEALGVFGGLAVGGTFAEGGGGSGGRGGGAGFVPILGARASGACAADGTGAGEAGGGGGCGGGVE